MPGACAAPKPSAAAARDPVDIVLIDIGLPGEDGFSVLDYLHEIGQFGLVVVTARGHEQDRLQALNAAPISISSSRSTFPTSRRVFRRLAPGFASKNRRNVSTRRYQQSGQRRLTGYSQNEHLVAPSGLALPLTQQEYRLLEVLMRNRNEVCSKVDLHTSLFTG